MTHVDITKLAYEKITNRYYKAIYLGLECIMDTTNGYINGTKLCSIDKDKTKRFINYIKSTKYKILKAYYMSNISDFSSELTIKVTDGPKEIRGTYLHPILFLDLAIWISPSAYIKATRIVSDALVRESNNEDKIDRLEKRLEEALAKREDAEKKAEVIMVKIVLQNEKTHAKLDKASRDSEEAISKIKLSLKRVETRIENLNEEDNNHDENFKFSRNCWWPSRNILSFYSRRFKNS